MIAVILLIAFLITGCEDKSVKTDHIIRIGVIRRMIHLSML